MPDSSRPSTGITPLSFDVDIPEAALRIRALERNLRGLQLDDIDGDVLNALADLAAAALRFMGVE